MATDVLTIEQRHICMSHNRRKNTAPELAFRQACWAHGLRYRLNSKLVGKPDMVFPRQKIAIFIDGCFWHGCPFHYTPPVTNREFWQEKLKHNRKRDDEVTKILQTDGWTVLRYWEHDIETEAQKKSRIDELKKLMPKNPHNDY